MATFVITAPCLLVVLVLVGRVTEWGSQFWRITGDYFRGRQSLPVWALSALLLVSTLIAVRINVLLSYYANDLFSALQGHLPGQRAWRRFGEGDWRTGVLVDAGGVRGFGWVFSSCDCLSTCT